MALEGLTDFNPGFFNESCVVTASHIFLINSASERWSFDAFSTSEMDAVNYDNFLPLAFLNKCIG